MRQSREDWKSKKCPPEAFWIEAQGECVTCQEQYGLKPGFEFSLNCGWSDDGGRHVVPHKECSAGSFNNGTLLRCQPCSSCRSSLLLKPCNSSADAFCCKEGQYVDQGECKDEKQPTSAWNTTLRDIRTTTGYNEPFSPLNSTKDPTESPIIHHYALFGLAAVSLLLCVCLSLIYIAKKRKRCFKANVQRYYSSVREASCEHISTDDSKNKNELLPPRIQAAPLPVVLNHLDVVEELVVLLDPDTPGVKNTRHLAANCSISFNWINYAYSMKDSRSPLIAVLEKIIANYPDWTVGHLAGLLSKIERNDAVAVLRKLVVNEQETI